MHSREKRGIFGNSMNMVSFGMTPTMPPNAKQSNGFYFPFFNLHLKQPSLSPTSLAT